MRHYPLNLSVEGRKCVVVGGGRVAERKVKGLLRSGADVQVISPELTEGLQRLVEEGRVSHHRRRYGPGTLSDAFLVFAATSERSVNAQIASDARASGVLANVADSADECTFILPAIMEQDGILIAVSTGGRSPALAKRVRDRLGELWHEIVAGIGSNGDGF